jgi:CheY-like chemotaxis protein
MYKPDAPEEKYLVLSVEDDDSAYLLIRTAFRHLGIGMELQRVENGEEALNFLKRVGRFSNAPKPRLILLNMNLPRMNGLEVLSAMQADQELRDIPAVVFSSSSLDADKAKCLALGARQFITKPNNYDEFVDAIRCACDFAHVS